MKKIVIIDDDRGNLDLLQFCFPTGEFEVVLIDNGPEGFEYIEQNASTIDVVLLDKMMPVKDGLSILKDIQNNVAMKNIPVIVQSGDEAKGAGDEAIKAGAFSYLKKPFDFDEVVELVREAIVKS